MSKRQHRIRKRLDLYAMYEQELEEELRKGLLTQHETRDAEVVIDRELRDNETRNINNCLERMCFTPEHPNHNIEEITQHED